MNYPRHIVALSILTILLFTTMFITSLVTGINQQYIETIHPLADYENALREGESILRFILTIDFIFIASYWLLGIFLVLKLWNENKRLLLALSAACISITAILDVIENNQFLMFMESVNQLISIEEEAVQEQMVSSSVKWQFSYFAFLFLGFAFPVRTQSERLAGFIMKFVQLPVGFLVYTIPASSLLIAAHMTRYGVLLLLLILLAIVARAWSSESVIQS